MSVTERAIQPRDRLIAGFAGLAIVIHVLEAGFPSPLPGIKPGLANVVVLIVLLRHGLAAAVWVNVLRVLAGSLLVGSFLAPGFWLSVGGASASLLALAIGHGCNRLLPPGARLSVVGLSVLAAVAHMGGQFYLAWTLFVPHPGLLRLAPLLLGSGLVFGLFTGLLAERILRRLPPAGGPSAV